MERAKIAVFMRVRLILAALLVLSLNVTSPEVRGAPPGDELALALRDNVVSIIAKWQNGETHDGFGFIVGERSGKLFIATANHVLRGSLPDELATTVEIEFFGRQGEKFLAKPLATSNKTRDLAVLRAPLPQGLTWRRDVVSAKGAQRLMSVWFVGRSGKWYVPSTPGKINEIHLDDSIAIDNLNVQVGTSGAPLIAESGIVGIITREEGGISYATSVKFLKRAFESWNHPWQLTALETTARQQEEARRKEEERKRAEAEAREREERRKAVELARQQEEERKRAEAEARKLCDLQLLAPKSNATIDQGERQSDGRVETVLNFMWRDCPEAERYHLYVIGPNAINPIIDNDNIKGAVYQDRSRHYGILNKALKGWTWKVRPYVDGKWGNWSETRAYNMAPAPRRARRPGSSTRAKVSQREYDTVQNLYGGHKKTADCRRIRVLVAGIQRYAASTNLVPRDAAYSVLYPTRKPNPTIGDLVVDRTHRIRKVRAGCF